MKFRILMVLLLVGALALTYYFVGNQSTSQQPNPTTADPGIKLQ